MHQAPPHQLVTRWWVTRTVEIAFDSGGQTGGHCCGTWRNLAGFDDDGSEDDGDALWLYADLKQHRYDYRALVARPWGQTGLDGNPPTMRDLSSVQSLEPRFWP